jgi:hypothetical protein
MKELFIKRLKPGREVSLAEAEQMLEKLTVSNRIDMINWKEFNYQPKVTFRIGHTGDEIWLKYYVSEKHIIAKETKINGEVYKDSCVEFFVSPDGKNYYNFEFSCIGITHLAWGPGRGNRKFTDPDLVRKLEIRSSLGSEPFEERTGSFDWEMMIRIPVECFSFDSIVNLNGLKGTANFYKCADGSSSPHYLTWNPVLTEKPDYHRPEFFGKILFE